MRPTVSSVGNKTVPNACNPLSRDLIIMRNTRLRRAQVHIHTYTRPKDEAIPTGARIPSSSVV